MWSMQTFTFSLGGMVSAGGAQVPGLSLDVYRAAKGADGRWQFEQLNAQPAISGSDAAYGFASLNVPVLAQSAISSTPTATEKPVYKPSSFPTLVFRVSRQVVENGSGLVEVYDERAHIDDVLTRQTDRVVEAKYGLSHYAIDIDLPASDPQVMPIAGMQATEPNLPQQEFRFGRVGRVLRNEIADVGSARAGYANPSSINVKDAPFGGRLSIGGWFGEPLKAGSNDVVYTVSYSPYSGNPAAPFDSAHETFITEPLVNTKYVHGGNRWENVPLGPVNDTYNGKQLSVYKRAPAPTTEEYWPWRDLVIAWNSAQAPNDLVILKLTAYTRKPGQPLQKCAMPDALLPLRIDNRPAAISMAGWETGISHFVSEMVSDEQPVGPCNVVEVTAVEQPDSNTCLEVRYSIEDGGGNAHPHVDWYSLDIAYTPRQTPSAHLEETVPLRPFLGHGEYHSHSDSYAKHASGPKFEVKNFTSVLVPATQWPTQQADGCGIYAAYVRLQCALRTTDGWGAAFGNPIFGRHLILRAA